MPERLDRPHPRLAVNGCHPRRDMATAVGIIERPLAPFAAEAAAMQLSTSLRTAVWLLPARESVRWIVERQRTSILSSRLVVMSSDDWVLRLSDQPASVPVVYVGPPLPPSARQQLQTIASDRLVYLLVQTGHAYRQWMRERQAPGVQSSLARLQAPGCGFCPTAIWQCCELVHGSRWSEIRICVPEDPGRELIAELWRCASARGVPLCCEELVSPYSSPVLRLVRLIAISDFRPDSIELAVRAVAHELGVDVSADLSGLPAACSLPVAMRATTLVRAARGIATRCAGRELHPGLAERVLDRAERTAPAAKSMTQWLESSFTPRWVTTGERDGVRVTRNSRAGVHAVQTTIVPYAVERRDPPLLASAYAVSAGAIVRIDGPTPTGTESG